MQTVSTSAAGEESGLEQRTAELFEQSQTAIHRRADRLFANLMIVQWLAGIAAAVWISPRTWIGATSQIHWHVWAAIFLGGAISSLPVFLAWKQPGRTLTRHVIAVAQMLTSALLIHLTGGRIETHFHVFGSLAFIAFYRDWRVLMSATVVVALDHMARGLFWPQSVFGVLASSPWRWMEHAGWVIFEDTFLLISIRHGLWDMADVASRQAKLEAVNAGIERQVADRTADLTAANRKMQASEARIRLILETVPECVKVVAADGTLLDLNSAGLAMIEVDLLEEVVGKSFYDLLPVKYQAASRSLNAAVFRGVSRTAQYEIIGMKGTHRWMETSAVPLRDGDGQIIAQLAVTRDITQRRQAEELLRLQEAVLRSAANVVVITDRSGLIVWVNPAFTKVTGYTAEEALGQNPRILKRKDMPANIPATFYQNLWRTISAGAVWHGEFRNSRKDGTLLIEEATITPVRDDFGRITHFVAVKQDITERKRAEEELAQAQKQLVESSRMAGMAEVATGVLHNVGNVLNSVNVSATIVAEKIKKSKSASVTKVAVLLREHENDLATFITSDLRGRQVPSFLNTLAEHLVTEQAAVLVELASLQKNIEHIKDVVSMQQSYAKISGVTETIHVAELLEDTLRMNASSLMRHEFQVVREFAPVPPLEVDKHKLLQILVNLVRNARHACDDAGRDDKQITLRIAEAGDRVRISVADNGVGIPAENLTRIFNHGFTTKKDGHGFGLHSGALAAKELGGSLSVASAGTGQGSVFTLELPVKPGSQQPAGN